MITRHILPTSATSVAKCAFILHFYSLFWNSHSEFDRLNELHPPAIGEGKHWKTPENVTMRQFMYKYLDGE